MIFATGGLAREAISTKSSPESSAFFKASWKDKTPTCLPSAATTRSLSARMFSFTRQKLFDLKLLLAKPAPKSYHKPVFASTEAFIRPKNSSWETAPRFSPVRSLTATAFFSSSLSPVISM